jgi:hypothetical protein
MNFLKSLFLLSLLSGTVCHGDELSPILNNEVINNASGVNENPANANHLAGVIGYQAATNNEIWQQKQLGFGVSAILQQALADKTLFSLLDEKVLLGIKNENLEEDLQAQWMLTENQTTPDTLKTLADKYQLTDIFWVKITDFSSKKSKISLGFIGHYEYKDTLTLEVCQYTTSSQTIKCEEGEAIESRSLNGILYQPTKNVDKNFKESGAGKLSQAAILEALTKLLKL